MASLALGYDMHRHEIYFFIMNYFCACFGFICDDDIPTLDCEGAMGKFEAHLQSKRAAQTRNTIMDLRNWTKDDSGQICRS
jgi:hypothetical protein